MKIVDVADTSARIVERISEVIVGKDDVLKNVWAGVLSGGHILFEDYPGLAKTLIARCFAQVLGVSFRRIQFTPDLLPSDITGSHILDRNRNQFEFIPGPVFTNVLLADEVNRATPKTQSALLEAMQEGQVSVSGETRPLSAPFVVIATQNPIEYEGTFPLPEAQLDRFIIRLSVGYPTQAQEVDILERRLARKQDEVELVPLCTGDDILAMRAAVEEVHVSPDIAAYIVAIVHRTRRHPSMQVGASPRGSLALVKLARARAAIDGRDYVIPDDVKALAGPALSHRILLAPELWARQTTADDVLESIVQSIPVPKDA